METLWQDAKYGLRMLAKSPGFTLIAVLSLAIGIGANTAVFSLVNAVLLEPLPYDHGDRLVLAVRKQPGVLRTVASYPDFMDWHDSGALASSAAAVGKGFFLETPDGPQPLPGRRVTGEFFDTLGVRPLLGRGFLPDEARNGNNVAVISYQLWEKRFARDPQAVGKDLRLRGGTFRIIGVLPQDYLDPLTLTVRDVYIPLVASAEERGPGGRNSQWIQVLGRLRGGVSVEQASAQIGAVSERALKDIPGRDPRSLAPFKLVSLQEHQVGDTKRALWLLLGAVGFVLLIGCANVSNLLLARITARQHELAVRAAVGASGRRLAAQLMTESLLLSFGGGTLALVILLWALDVVRAITPENVPRLDHAGLDVRVFGFAFLITVVAGLLFGLLPMLRGTRQDVVGALKRASGTGGVPHTRSRSALLIAEVALTMILLVGATLALTSLARLVSVDAGFQPANVLTVNFTYAGEWKLPQQTALLDQLLPRLRSLPGVRAAGSVDTLPFSGAWSQFTTDVNGFAADPRPEMKGKTFEYQQGVVAGDYFRVMGIPLKAGRYFDDSDSAPGARTVIVSELLARTIWGGADPIGRLVSDEQTKNARVVGVVGNVRHFSFDTQFVQTLYRPLTQRQAWGVTLVVLADRDPAKLVPAIRQGMRGLDSSVILRQANTMDEVLQRRTAAARFLAALLGSFGSVALLLAVCGIYSVLAYSVSQRTREIGVRVALGAQSGALLRMVIRNGMTLAAAGIAIGLAGAIALSRFLRGQLYEVSPTDPWIYAAVVVLLGTAALLACWIPARRAARVDPMVALRYE